MPLILICSSFAPLAVVAFFPFFCRFSLIFARFLLCCACVCFRVFLRCFSCLCKIIFAFFAFAKSAFAYFFTNVCGAFVPIV